MNLSFCTKEMPWFLLAIDRYFQSTQNNKFVISSQYLKKEERNEVRQNNMFSKYLQCHQKDQVCWLSFVMGMISLLRQTKTIGNYFWIPISSWKGLSVHSFISPEFSWNWIIRFFSNLACVRNLLGGKMMMMNCTVAWWTNKKRLALFPTGTIAIRISDTPWAEFEPARNVSSGLVEWNCAVAITSTPRRHIITTQRRQSQSQIFWKKFQKWAKNKVFWIYW